MSTATALMPINGTVQQPNEMAIYSSSPLQGIARVKQMVETMTTIRTFLKEALVKGVDFGPIPGTGTKDAQGREVPGKDVLYQPGAAKAIMFFDSYPEYKCTRIDLGGGHMEVTVETQLIYRGDGTRVGTGLGSCSTMEKKYRVRNGSRVCPTCQNATALKKSKPNDRNPNETPYFYCWDKIGGCGARFDINDPEITGQVIGQVDNPDIYDTHNTVLKMAVKRSMVAAAISLGCLSEMYTQDLEETWDIDGTVTPTAAQPTTAQPTAEPAQPKTAPAPKAATPPPSQAPKAAPTQAPPAQAPAAQAPIKEKEIKFWGAQMIGQNQEWYEQTNPGMRNCENVFQLTRHICKVLHEFGEIVVLPKTQAEAYRVVDGFEKQNRIKQLAYDYLYNELPQRHLDNAAQGKA